ncbi:MAG: hypothetical protein MJZ77_06985 [Bacteroidales bacterium]|nr:hypothetical protein [Bacteroidales bacterium]
MTHLASPSLGLPSCELRHTFALAPLCLHSPGRSMEGGERGLGTRSEGAAGRQGYS